MTGSENLAAPGDRLTPILEAGLTVPGAAEIAAPFLPTLTDPARGVQAILLYGSVLWRAVRGPSSQPDFIAVVPMVHEAGTRVAGDRLWRAVLPPSVYCLRANGTPAKISVVTARALAEQTSPRARDLHLAGRLSKRVALVWARDARARQTVVDAQRAALVTVARLALGRGVVALDGFLLALLALSYESEVRIVEPGKIAALFEVEREHYRAVGRALLAALRPSRSTRRPPSSALPDGVAHIYETLRMLRRSRRRVPALAQVPRHLRRVARIPAAEAGAVGDGGSHRAPAATLIFALPVLYRMVRAGYVG